jgi:hypothetical protein
MARKAARPQPTATKQLQPLCKNCPPWGEPRGADYDNVRTLTTLEGLIRLPLQRRRCRNPAGAPHLRPSRPEAEGRYALPQHEFGLDVIALVGALRSAEHRRIPESHRQLGARGRTIGERSVTNLLDRSDELRAVSGADETRLRKLLTKQKRVRLALDGLQPDVGHEVLWVVRDCLSGEVLLAKSLRSGRQEDLATLLRNVRDRLPGPIEGGVPMGSTRFARASPIALGS